MTIADKIKSILVEDLNLEGLAPGYIEDDAPLFGEGLGLDSLDAVELVVIVQKHFGIEIKDMEEGRAAFRSINALASPDSSAILVLTNFHRYLNVFSERFDHRIEGVDSRLRLAKGAIIDRSLVDDLPGAIKHKDMRRRLRAIGISNPAALIEQDRKGVAAGHDPVARATFHAPLDHP